MSRGGWNLPDDLEGAEEDTENAPRSILGSRECGGYTGGWGRMRLSPWGLRRTLRMSGLGGGCLAERGLGGGTRITCGETSVYLDAGGLDGEELEGGLGWVRKTGLLCIGFLGGIVGLGFDRLTCGLGGHLRGTLGLLGFVLTVCALLPRLLLPLAYLLYS